VSRPTKYGNKEAGREANQENVSGRPAFTEPPTDYTNAADRCSAAPADGKTKLPVQNEIPDGSYELYGL